MNCASTRFLLYAYLDRDLSPCEAQALARHLAECGPCEARARSARGLVKLLRSRLGRAPVPARLRIRLEQRGHPVVRPRYPVFATAAAILLLILPLVADVPGRRPAPTSPVSLATLVPPPLRLVARRLSGTLVCLHCETRLEAGLCPLPQAEHEPGLCADNGEVWRLMSRDNSFTQASAGQTVTIEGIAFPQSGFLRASRVGY